MNNKGATSKYFPCTWTFEAWDGSNWVVLDSQSGVTLNDWFNNPEQRFTFENTNYYNKYRVNVTATVRKSSVGSINLVICELQMMEKISKPSEPESIILDRNTLDLPENSQDKLTATVTPDSANVIWTISDESIATVDQNGNVTAIKEGVVTVTAQVENTNLTANCIVTVKKQGSLESESITLDRNALELLEGSQDKLTATVLPEDSLNKNVIWSSSDESIATVDQNGNVTAIREGEATIFAKVENTELVATATVVVKKANNEYSSAILSYL